MALLNAFFGLELTPNTTLYQRTSVRAIVKRDDKYLMIQTRRGDMIFAGGSVEEGETRVQALERELLEETGYSVSGHITYLGKIITRRHDRIEPQALFEAQMYFYLCEGVDYRCEPDLSEREIELDMKAVWATQAEILKNNKVYAASIAGVDYWVDMVSYVLKTLDDADKGEPNE